MADVEAAIQEPRPRYLLARAWLVERLQTEPEPQAWLDRIQRLDVLAEQMESESHPMRRLDLLSVLLCGWIELVSDARHALPGPAPPPLFPRSRPRGQRSALAILQRALAGPTLVAGLVSDEFERLAGVDAAAELLLESTRDLELTKVVELLDVVSPAVRSRFWELDRP